jgi:membrane protease YdiL (CAAX protease family)
VTLLGLGLALFGPFALALADEGRRGKPGLAGSLLGEAAYVGLVAVVLWIAFVPAGLTPEALGLGALRWQSVAWGAALLLFFQCVYGPALYWALRRLRLPGFAGGLAKLQSQPLWVLVLAVAIGGTAEELLYRGYAIAQLERLGAALWLAALLPLVVFTFAHIPLWGLAPALTTFFAGGIFTLFFLWQRDLWPNVIAHVATDFVGIVLALRAAGQKAY